MDKTTNARKESASSLFTQAGLTQITKNTYEQKQIEKSL
ncbi:hypothetical protein LEP1GSC105_4113 [Leptospira interrogans str. UI 12758]|uniref:Uncharacterized protein n=1 Tax=Leptospira interrogans str. UI 12758 TaxID=1049938 RepID=A0A0E2DBW9_LEPIR|nr:hypothetical protein LEP1GSC105_4117 [Leptospira interrogans str. UI 12758]EKR57140.1 hypothetical protein LEP1GSC105_4113 [Leptospira interrogans str. UI 12758]